MPDNNGLVTRFQNLQSAKPLPGPETIRKNSVAAAVRNPSARVYHLPSKRRASELGELRFEVPSPEDDERISRRIGIALLVVTFIVFAILLWPYLSEQLA